MFKKHKLKFSDKILFTLFDRLVMNEKNVTICYFYSVYIIMITEFE